MSDDSQKPHKPDEPIPSDLVREDPTFADIVLQFVDGLDNRLKQLESALRNSDFETLSNVSHQLKGSGGGHGYPIVTEKAAALETFAKKNAMEECIDAFSELKGICTRLVVSNDQSAPDADNPSSPGDPDSPEDA